MAGTALAYALSARGPSRTTASAAGTLSLAEPLAEPLAAALLGVFVPHEHLTAHTTAGSLILLIGPAVVAVPVRTPHFRQELRIQSRYDRGMSDAAPGLSADQLGAYFTLVEVSSLLQYAVDEHLRIDGDLSYVQFQLLARLADAPGGRLRMTDLADGVVYSRSGLTYQAGLLAKRGLITRAPSPDDERSVLVAVTDAGRDLVARVLPGHVDRVRSLLFDSLDGADVTALGAVLGRVRDHMRAAPPRSAKPRARRAR